MQLLSAELRKEYCLTAGYAGLFHTPFRVGVLLIVEDLTVTLKCRIVIKALQSSGHFTFNLE